MNFTLHTVMWFPNGKFVALGPHCWPHWYFWDCACNRS